MITIGLTGGIACGKSTVGRLLRARGVPVLDLDQVARDIVAPGQPALVEIAERWPDVVRDGVLDRKALGAKVVGDADARRALEAITHARIWARMEAWLVDQAAADAPVVVVEATLMVETGSWRRYDKLLVVSASPEIQVARLARRDGLEVEAARRWLATQLPLAEKERLASAVIRNDGTPERLEASLDEAWSALVGGA